MVPQEIPGVKLGGRAKGIGISGVEGLIELGLTKPLSLFLVVARVG